MARDRRRARSEAPKPRVRGALAKINELGARALRSGHPWVFRESLLRPVAADPGSLISVADPDGNPLAYGIVEREGPIAVRLLGFGAKREWTRAEMLERANAAAAARTTNVDASCRGAMRLIHGEADGFPGFAADRYGDFIVAYKYADSVDAWLDTALEVVAEVWEPQGIYLQQRVRSVRATDRRVAAEHRHGKVAPPLVEVGEDGLTFLVDVTAPTSPGLFLDLREGRRIAEARSAERRVLNLFSFTGAFGVRAARAGASEVVNVDAAARSHARCRQNLSASELDAEACEALAGDVFKHLEKFRQRRRSFDLVVVDPPPFSNVDGQSFSALRDWEDLAQAASAVVAPGGEMLAVCNAAGLNDHEFLAAVGRGCIKAGRAPRLIHEVGLPPDFPVLPAFSEGRYLKVKLLQIR